MKRRLTTVIITVLFVLFGIVGSATQFQATLQDTPDKQSIISVIDDFWNIIIDRETTTKKENDPEPDVPTPPTTAPTTPTTAPTTVTPEPVVDEPEPYVPEYDPEENENEEPTTAPTTAPETESEEESSEFIGNLSELLSGDNGQIIMKNEEIKTLAPLTPPTQAAADTTSGVITWEMAAIFGILFVFIVLLALLIALFVQKHRMEAGQVGTPSDTRSSDRHKSARKGRTKRNESDELKFDYGDPLIRKYTDGTPTRSRRDIEEINPDDIASRIRQAAVSNRIEKEYPGIDHSIFDTKVARQEPVDYDDDLSAEDVLRQTDSLLSSLNEKYGIDDTENSDPVIATNTDEEPDEGIDIDFSKYADETEIPTVTALPDDEEN